MPKSSRPASMTSDLQSPALVLLREARISVIMGRHHGDDRMRQGTADPDGNA